MSLRYYIFFFFSIVLLLLVRFYIFYKDLPGVAAGKPVIIHSRINNDPKIDGKLQRFTINVKSRRIFVVTTKSITYSFGDNIELKGKISVSKQKGKEIYSLAFPVISKVENRSNYLLSISLWIREKAIEVFESALAPVHADLLLGIVFGIKRNMPMQFLDQLRDAGVIHVIAASGMNVSMAAGAMFYLFNGFLSRKYAIILSLFGIVFYVLIAGFEASIVRAAIMAGFTVLAGLSGRQKKSVYFLILTVFVMLLINPAWLSDVGFQLSFLATLGIIILKPLLDIPLIKFKKVGALRDDLSTTLAAQIATMPVILANFGTVNLLSVLVNVLVLWTVPFLMILGSISVIMGLFFTQLGTVFTYLSIPLLTYFELVVRWSDNVKIPFSVENSSPLVWIGYYLILISIVVFINKNKDINRD